MVTWDTGLFRTAGYLWFKGLLIHCLFRIARLALIETALGLLSRNRSIHPTRHQASGIGNLTFIFVLFGWAFTARIIRSEVLSLRNFISDL